MILSVGRHSDRQLLITFSRTLWIVDEGHRLVGPFDSQTRAATWQAAYSAGVVREIELPHDNDRDITLPEEARL